MEFDYVTLERLDDFKELQDVYNENKFALKKKVEEDITTATVYNNSDGTTIAVGGIPKDTSFKDKTIKQMLTSLLYPYVEITDVVCGAKGGDYEIGSSATLTSVPVSFTAGSENCTKLEIFKDGSSIGKREGTILVSGTSVSIPSASQQISVQSSTGESVSVKITATASDNKGMTSKPSEAKIYCFHRPYYIGAISTLPSTWTSSNITALRKNIGARPGSVSVTLAANNYCIIAYPAIYSDIKSVKDINGLDVTSSIQKTSCNVTCLDGKVIPYKVYYGLKNTATADFIIYFK